MPSPSTPSLYGITRANSSRNGADLWGKNQFNSTFPLALCIYMRDHGEHPVAVLARRGRIETALERKWSMAEIVGRHDENPYYHFEAFHEPYGELSRNEPDKIDLVVAVNGTHHMPLELKLTVVPDSGTAKAEEEHWGPEVVLRPVSSAYAMMSVATALFGHPMKNEVIGVLRPAYNLVGDWTNAVEIARHGDWLVRALGRALELIEELQRPFLLQPIWKTRGQSLELCEQCFDVFVWSDVAVMRLPIAILTRKLRSDSASVPRPLREVARHVRGLYDLLTTKDYDYSGIYKGMPLGSQTDKSFAISGRVALRYLRHKRLRRPLLHRRVLQDLILHGGERSLQPERRFDAAVQAHMVARS